VQSGIPFSVYGELKSIDSSNPKLHTWTIALDGKEIKVFLEQPVKDVLTNKNGEKEFVSYENVKVGDWVFVDWKDYTPGKKGKIDTTAKLSAKVNVVHDANSQENLMLLNPKGDFTKRNFFMIYLNAKTNNKYGIDLVTNSEDGTGRGTLFSGRTIDGKEQKLGCYENIEKEICTGSVVAISENKLVLHLTTESIKENPNSLNLFLLGDNVSVLLDTLISKTLSSTPDRTLSLGTLFSYINPFDIVTVSTLKKNNQLYLVIIQRVETK
jgi:hypothetical protein